METFLLNLLYQKIIFWYIDLFMWFYELFQPYNGGDLSVFDIKQKNPDFPKSKNDLLISQIWFF